MSEIVISGSGVYTPPESISNEELAASFNSYVRQFNQFREKEISAGEIEPLRESGPDFIYDVSGIRSRYVVNKEGILDPGIMRPKIREYSDEGKSIQAMMGEHAGREALNRASRRPEDVDAVITACTAVQRLYPPVSIEIQKFLGAAGFALDLQAACSSMPFGIQTAADAVRQGSANSAVVISPEICTARVDFRDRESHFLFGDAGAAVVIERKETSNSGHAFEILSTRLRTTFSETVSNRFGFLNQASMDNISSDAFFRQEGKRLFRDIVPLASDFIREHLDESGVKIAALRRLWLHQANRHINGLIGKRIFGREATPEEVPIILDEYANTSSAGAIIAFNKHNKDLKKGDMGLICAFGAGYSIGSVLLRKL
ncbi:MAG: beta-ketoacyl-ACP synthase III [Deltaproteobacteria bacterium]